jgi:Ubiquitin carboxyl-terminal hydrolase
VFSPATKQFLISQPPLTLVLHAKRFYQGAYGHLRKIDSALAFPRELDLTPFCLPEVREHLLDVESVDRLVQALDSAPEPASAVCTTPSASTVASAASPTDSATEEQARVLATPSDTDTPSPSPSDSEAHEANAPTIPAAADWAATHAFASAPAAPADQHAADPAHSAAASQTAPTPATADAMVASAANMHGHTNNTSNADSTTCTPTTNTNSNHTTASSSTPTPGPEPTTKQWDPLPRSRQKAICAHYRLRGLVVHSGGMGGGHYVAYVRQPRPATTGQHTEESYKSNGNAEKDEWLYISDTHVTPVPSSRVRKAQAYILFYERIDKELALRQWNCSPRSQ